VGLRRPFFLVVLGIESLASGVGGVDFSFLLNVRGSCIGRLKSISCFHIHHSSEKRKARCEVFVPRSSIMVDGSSS
jgi:hypothetical protein